MTAAQIEDKVMDELPENHREVIKQLKPDDESILDLDKE
jgi:hypothetical protein